MEISELELTPIIAQDDGTFKIGHSRVTREQLLQMRAHIDAALAGEVPAPKPVKAPEPKKVYDVRKLSDGRIAIVTPYSDIVKDECKRLMGKWGSFTKTDADGIKSSVAAWLLDGSHIDHMRAFLADLYDGAKVEKIITFSSEEADEAPSIDGASILTFTRDRRGRINHDAILEIIEDTLFTGGSARYPTLRGTLKVRARIRANAVVEWTNPASVKIEDVPQK